MKRAVCYHLPNILHLHNRSAYSSPCFPKVPKMLGPWLPNTYPNPFLHPVDKAVLPFNKLQLFLHSSRPPLGISISGGWSRWSHLLVVTPCVVPLPYRVGVTHILSKILQKKWIVTSVTKPVTMTRELWSAPVERPTWPRTRDSCTWVSRLEAKPSQNCSPSRHPDYSLSNKNHPTQLLPHSFSCNLGNNTCCFKPLCSGLIC